MHCKSKYIRHHLLRSRNDDVKVVIADAGLYIETKQKKTCLQNTSLLIAQLWKRSTLNCLVGATLSNSQIYS